MGSSFPKIAKDIQGLIEQFAFGHLCKDTKINLLSLRG